MPDTRIPIFNADAQTAYIDYRSEATNGDGRQVIVIGDPSINNNVAAVATQDLGGSDQTTPGVVVRLAGSAQVNITAVNGTLAVTPISGSGDALYDETTNGVKVTNTTAGTLQVNIGKIDDYVAVRFNSTPGTVGVNLGKVDGTIQTNIGKIDDVVSIRFNTTSGTAGVNIGKQDGTLNVNVGKISDTIAIWHTGTSGTQVISLDRDKATLSGILSSVGVNIGKIDGTIQVKLDQASVLAGITSTVAIHHLSTGGTIAVKLDPGAYALVNAFHTAGIFTVSGSTSGVSASGVNLIAPSASYNFKIFAYSIQTTALASVVPRFVNGSGASQTEFWRPLITAATTTSAPIGANLAVTPPGYLFATGTNTSLNLHLDTGVLVHYSVSYIKESA